MADGTLFYLVGASGSGKDSLIRYAREKLSVQPCIVFAHRYITRPADAGGENHIALSDTEFQARLDGRLFAMHWDGHGHRYAIGIELNQWLAKGCAVVVNGSREYLPTARQKYPELRAVYIQVSAAVLAERLASRGRESSAMIEDRLLRAGALHHLSETADIILNNDGPLEQAGGQLIHLLLNAAGKSCS